VSVASHPIALAQCRSFLRAHPWLGVYETWDTAAAAREVAEAGDPRRAAIAGPAAAARYGLMVLAAGIADRSDNATRFVSVVPR
jgi:prephenate dehydratase